MRAARCLASFMACAALAGCGGSVGGSANTTAKTLTVRASTTMTVGRLGKPRFIAQVNGLCRRAWPIILKNFNDYVGHQEPKSGRKRLFAKAVRGSFLNNLDLYTFDDIRALKAPRGEKVVVEEVIGKMQAAVELGWWHVHVYSPSQLSAQFAEYNQAARQYGIVDCLVDGRHLPRIPA